MPGTSENGRTVSTSLSVVFLIGAGVYSAAPVVHVVWNCVGRGRALFLLTCSVTCTGNTEAPQALTCHQNHSGLRARALSVSTFHAARPTQSQTYSLVNLKQAEESIISTFIGWSFRNGFVTSFGGSRLFICLFTETVRASHESCFWHSLPICRRNMQRTGALSPISY